MERTVQKMDGPKNDVDVSDGSHIAKTFAGATVFLTGGTGFLGKLLVEKLLRVYCPGVKKIYLLTRSKKEKNISQRMNEQFEDELYDRLREEQPHFIDKIAVIEGDVRQINLGMSDEDRAKIINQVDFIFHGAATVKFDEDLKIAVDINVRGTREMMSLARACTKLRALVHVSTAYSNCPLVEIDEKFYDFVMPGEKLIDLVEGVDEKTLKAITPGLLGDFPNTYTYTKAAAENLVQKYSKGLPVAVLRPSIVISTAKEPVAGWIDNIYGPTGVVTGAAIGIIRVVQLNAIAVADLVPCDYVVNSCIAAAWKTARDCPGNKEDALLDQEPAIYNYVSSAERPITWGSFMKYSETYALQMPSVRSVWAYLLIVTTSKFTYSTRFFLLHWVPACIIDAIAVMIGRKPMLKKIYKKVDKLNTIIGNFTFGHWIKDATAYQWTFHNDNTQKLYKELSDTDKSMFNFDMKTVNWSEYCVSYIKGIRQYITRDPLETLPEAKRKQIKFKILHYTLLILMFLAIFKLFVYICQLFLNLLS